MNDFKLTPAFRRFQPVNRTRALRGLVISMPLIFLTAYLIGGEPALLACTVVLPFIGLLVPRSLIDVRQTKRRSAFGLLTEDDFDEAVARLHADADKAKATSALFMISVDDIAGIVERYGPAVRDQVIETLGTRLRTVLRDDDLLSHYADDTFAICLDPSWRVDLEAGIQMSGRLARVVEEPFIVGNLKVYVTVSCGFCLSSRAPKNDSPAWIDACLIALAEARKQGGSAIRAYSKDLQAARIARADLRASVGEALEQDQIVAFFQPQISNHTGAVSGFEALARWQHPEKGTLPPPVFLEAMEEAGFMSRLCETMLSQSLAALQHWGRAGFHIPQVGVNFSAAELMLPDLKEQVAWELDRFNMAPNRLSIEILETVMADSPDDMVARNINALRDLGCALDLDDFGTGHASLSAIRRFRVNRIKIDRSFVMKADRDADQQQMIAAILTMAEQLDVKTLAEGVETTGEHALLAQLGCDHVQGFGIARPMPFDQTLPWLTAHDAKLRHTPEIQSRSAS